ncbi:cytochrome P450 [Fusarium albosuccineum]|uniref:Cytochrome P450 n=1 Tax=Fusarium albosuccineum TaxID=1237068 RepID=A0A8H4NRD9_9HYPO|nr:cytochrome P450 [Fusarium albosuccineum]
MINHLITSGAFSLLEIGLLRYSHSLPPTNLLRQFLPLVAANYLLIQLFYILIWPFFFSPLRNLPGPKQGGYLLLGQILSQMKALPSELEIRWMKEYPDAPFIRYLSLLNREVLMVNNAHAQKAVLQTKCYSFVKPPFWERIIGEIAGKGILFTEGREHRKQRRLLIGLAALGYELNSLSTSSELAMYYAKIFEFVTPLQVAISFVNQFVPIRSVLPFEANRSYVDANAQVRRILREHIRHRRDEYHQGKIKGEKASRDLLTLMIEESQDAWSEEEMLGYVGNCSLAHVLANGQQSGHETTAGALTWALYVLTLEPGIQKRVREEVQTKITSLLPTQSEIENLPYMNNFLSEVLRFYPPAPAAPQFNPLIWGPTADEFNPDRWDSLPSPARDPHVSLAFSSGPRVCIGKQFALLEMKVIMVELIRNFEFENTGPVEPQKSGPSLRPINGMRLNVSAMKRS